jgi:hypothetical protein
MDARCGALTRSRELRASPRVRLSAPYWPDYAIKLTALVGIMRSARVSSATDTRSPLRIVHSKRFTLEPLGARKHGTRTSSCLTRVR